MIKRFYILTFLLLPYYNGIAQKLLITNWTKYIGGTSGGAIINATIATPDKSIVFAGYTNCNGTGNIPSSSYASENILLGKLDSNEQIVWIKTYGGSGDDEGMSVCNAVDGGFAILSKTTSTDGDVVNFKGTSDVLLLRVDENGNKLWAKTFGSPFSEEAVYVTSTPDNGFIVLGVNNGFGDDIPSHYTNSQFVFDWFVIKVDKFGNKQWIKVFGGNNEEDNSGTILVANNGYYLISASMSKDHDCNDTSWHTQAKNTLTDYYILKLDTAGNLLWRKSYGGSDHDVTQSAILDAVDSTIVIAGTSRSNNYWATGNNGETDEWVVKVDKNGNLIWAKMYGNSYDEGNYSSIIKDTKGNYALVTIRFGGGFGLDDLLLFVLDTSGKKIAEKLIGGNSNEHAGGIVPYKQGYVVGGTSLSNAFTEGINSTRWGTGMSGSLTRVLYFPSSISKKTNPTEGVLHITPNPANDYVSIEIPDDDTKNPGLLKASDSKGRTIFTKKYGRSNNKISINTADWPPGIYLITWQTSNSEIYSVKLVHN